MNTAEDSDAISRGKRYNIIVVRHSRKEELEGTVASSSFDNLIHPAADVINCDLEPLISKQEVNDRRSFLK